MKRALAVLACVAMVGVVAFVAWPGHTAPEPILQAIGPRTVSNQTASPLALYGEHFRPGMSVHFGAPVNAQVTPEVRDPGHAYLRLPAFREAPATVQISVPVSIEGGSAPPVPLTVVNDLGFPDLIAVAVSPSGRVAAISTTTDQLFSVDPTTGAVVTAATGDGPSALAAYVDEGGHPRLLVAHRWSSELWSFPDDLSAPPKKVAAPNNVSALVVRAGTAYLAEQTGDSVVALALADGRVQWRAAVAPNPGVLALAGDSLAVGSQGAGVVETIDLATGAVHAAIQPGSDVTIVGGRTAHYARYVVGGKAVRGLAWAPSLQRLFVTSIGPNVGPNPDRMEISLNPGVGIVDPARGRFEAHLGFDEGLDNGLAFDDAAALLYVADTGLGLVRVLDGRKLGSIKDAGASLLQRLPIPAPAGFPRVRRARDFTPQTAGDEVHSGPFALALAPDARTLYVLDRFTGTLAVVDVRDARAGHASVLRQIPLVQTSAQRTRRMGQVLYTGDLARTGLTCEACHLEGNAEGVFFAKTHPLRLYRAPTVRGAKDTPPYFTPASTHSLAQTSQVVGNRNRLFRLPLTPSEIDALTTFTSAMALPPNPFLDGQGAPPADLSLPWGGTGAPQRGEAVFHRLGCQKCHPAPLFTLDQDGATRGSYLDVGTPHALALHPEWQEMANGKFAVPSLLGAWDTFPMLTSGAAGFRVDGTALRLSTRWPLKATLEQEPPPHATAQLTAAERADLEAFLLSL